MEQVSNNPNIEEVTVDAAAAAEKEKNEKADSVKVLSNWIKQIPFVSNLQEIMGTDVPNIVSIAVGLDPTEEDDLILMELLHEMKWTSDLGAGDINTRRRKDLALLCDFMVNTTIYALEVQAEEAKKKQPA